MLSVKTNSWRMGWMTGTFWCLYAFYYPLLEARNPREERLNVEFQCGALRSLEHTEYRGPAGEIVYRKVPVGRKIRRSDFSYVTLYQTHTLHRSWLLTKYRCILNPQIVLLGKLFYMFILVCWGHVAKFCHDYNMPTSLSGRSFS